MIALDTNVVVRMLVADDARQTKRARQLLERCRERKERFSSATQPFAKSNGFSKASTGRHVKTLPMPFRSC